MRARVNLQTCQGIGLCEMKAPAVFEVAEQGFASVLTAEVAASEEEAVRDAATSCPTDSITIEE